MVFGDLVWKKDAVDPMTGKKFKHRARNEEGAWRENDDPSHRPLVLEHHSQATDPKVEKGANKTKDTDEDGYDRYRPLRQLAAENWDAPIIVTTTVQFFDSLFSRRPADARKLHNLCQSVVIFDEVQTLPPLLLQPILDALKELAGPMINPAETNIEKRNKQRPYGCSLVLCTATQPALSNCADFEVGLDNPTPIITSEAARSHFSRLKRVEYHGLTKGAAPPMMDNETISAAMLAAPKRQALTILNTRRQARSLFDALQAEANGDESLRDAIFHLSTWTESASGGRSGSTTEEFPDQTVLQEYQSGYNFKGKLLRPAMVRGRRKALTVPP